jgi:DNA-binding NtrC family response regulator
MKKILVVDDEAEVRAVLRSFLRSKHYDVITASNGTEAVKLVREEHPHVVLLDINMPGKNGIEVLDEIRAYDPNIGVIMVTGESDEMRGNSTLQKGAFEYIKKPFSLEYLENTLMWNLQWMN